MAVTWTEDQRRVIDTRKKNILVSAAAGSGKSAVRHSAFYADHGSRIRQISTSFWW